MKFYSRFSNLMILMMLFIPNSLTHAITMALEIHELVDESDIVVIGSVTSSQLVNNNIDTQDPFKKRLGKLYSIEVDKVLYGKGEIKQEIFSDSHIGTINMNLQRNRKQNPVKLFAFRAGSSVTLGDRAAYYKSQSQLFFLKVSTFPAPLPDTAVILGRNRSSHGSRYQQLTKSDLTEKFYFEACFGVRQSTWVLTEQKQRTELPTVEAFCEVMSIPNLVQREQRLRGLLNDDDTLLARNARAALRKIEQSRKAKKRSVVR